MVILEGGSKEEEKRGPAYKERAVRNGLNMNYSNLLLNIQIEE